MQLVYGNNNFLIIKNQKIIIKFQKKKYIAKINIFKSEKKTISYRIKNRNCFFYFYKKKQPPSIRLLHYTVYTHTISNHRYT